MKDKLLEAMKSPHCLAGIVPDNGGMWLASCHTGGPYPSATPRNFATEPATWQTFVVAYNAIGTRDFQFDLTVVLDDFPTATKPVFYDAAYGVFGLTVSNNTTTNFYFYFKNLVDGANASSVSASKASAAPWYNAPQLKIGKNYFRIKRTGATLEITVNGYTFSVTGSAPLSPSFYRPDTVVSQFGAIVDLSLRVAGEIAYHYPSEAERVRLLTYSNVRTDRGVFEAATPAAWSIKTPLAVTPGTVLARNGAGVVTANPTQWKNGVWTGGTADTLTALAVFDYVMSTDEIKALS